MLNYRIWTDGSKKLVAGHDINYLAESGLLSLSTDKNGTPILPNTQIADIAGGSYPAFMNILLGLFSAIRKGRGCYLDIFMYENMIFGMVGVSSLFLQ